MLYRAGPKGIHAHRLAGDRPGGGADRGVLPVGVGGEDQGGAQARRHLAGLAGHAADLARDRRPRLRHRGLPRDVLHPEPGLRRTVRAMIPAGRIEPPAWMTDPPTERLFAALPGGGIAARFVGGCVRNAVLGHPVDDLDLAVDKPPEAVMRALDAAKIKVVPTGLAHGTVTAIANSRVFELTTLRRDVETDGRRAVVAFTDDWLADAGRRDFTFNALYADPDGTLYDPFEGRADLAAGKVRFIGDPDMRIGEDRLRVLRFFRFHAWYGRLPLDGPSYQACARNAAALGSLSGERVRKELLRTLQAPGAADALDAMLDAGVLDHWLPDYAGSARLRGLIAREDRPDGLRRL